MMPESIDNFVIWLLGAFCLILIITLASQRSLTEKFSKQKYSRSNGDEKGCHNNRESLETALTETIANAKKRNSKARNYYWRKPNNWIRMFTLIAVAAYTGVTYWQLTILKATERRQLRGYLGITEMTFDCGDCLPTEEDHIFVASNNFGQTPLYIINGIIWPTEFGIDEEFPESDIHKSPETTGEFVPKSMVVYPKNPNSLTYSVNDIFRRYFWEAKYGTYWLMIRGFVRYRDIFDSQWDNFFCFIYDPTRYKKGTGFVGCAKYDKEEPAGSETTVSRPEIQHARHTP